MEMLGFGHAQDRLAAAEREEEAQRKRRREAAKYEAEASEVDRALETAEEHDSDLRLTRISGE